MNSPLVPPPPAPPLPQRSTWKKKALIVTCVLLGAAGLAIASTAWLVKRNVFASPFTPVALTSNEQSVLNDKLTTLKQAAEAPVDPEVAKRTLTLSEKEINAFLEQQGMGEQIKVSLNNGGATATFLLPIGENAEIGKGMTLRLGLSVAAKMDANKKFSLAFSDFSVAGVPLPNAWLGGIKGLNLLNEESVASEPALQALAAGIRDFRIESGLVRIVLNE